MKTLTGLAAAALIALALSGCAPAAPPSTDTDTGTTPDDTSGEFAGVTLPGTGEYAVPDEAPIGGYELPDNQDALPDGCTWSVAEADGAVIAESNGPFVFLTDATATFITDGCPDWVQFE